MLRVFRFPPHRLHLWSHRTAGTEQRSASSSRKASDLWEDPGHVCAYLSCMPRPCPPQDGGFSDDEKLTFLEQSGIIALHQPSVSTQPGWQIGLFRKGHISCRHCNPFITKKRVLFFAGDGLRGRFHSPCFERTAFVLHRKHLKFMLPQFCLLPANCTSEMRRNVSISNHWNKTASFIYSAVHKIKHMIFMRGFLPWAHNQILLDRPKACFTMSPHAAVFLWITAGNYEKSIISLHKTEPKPQSVVK